ncbi:alpha-L-fucosidase [Algoriphagus boritolerans]|uniref:alpha-L-fucosidase n=1 Tax=Algoriphagus boritolerans DSM 17298 = JCM 18970 TaxID=1120964 RepID=A0A1H6AIH3_9BACT|nr:alpha-L-fucosidase [Algoriphagus boritolerans]SEG47887.1 alpha-L-fucosidase [Algoriphagus boritolerans DSM 17298 = JCM 18970]
MKKYIWPFLILSFTYCQEKAAPPEPILPIPNERQIAWQELQYYGFVHFNMNTFSDREWGFGDEKPEQFNPTALDTRQWARIAKEAGMKGLIITAKHHDGFVLWPSKYTEHSVKNSPWRDGKGDLIQEFVDACREEDLKVGIYYSPWDRNHPDYGKPEYVTYMRNQLTELLTNYGEIFEIWFDGANGGTGWYGGANEERKVDKFSYYDWPTTIDLVRKLQPNAMLFSDAGPDVRWVGNEHGFAYETTWSNLMRDSVYAGMPEFSEKWATGQENGTHWVPAESDVSIRPGWYYHAYEDHKVKTLPELMEIYYKSIGQNSSLLINFPVDRRGLIHEKDEEAILKMAAKIKEDFATNLVKGATLKSADDRGKGYEVKNLADGDFDTYWTTPDGQIEASVELDFGKNVSFNRLLLQEFVNLGQRVKAFSLEKEVNGNWEKIAEGTTIGYKRILRFADTEAQKIRINFLDGKGIPIISEIGVFSAPALLFPPKISRTPEGKVSITAAEESQQIYFSLDGNAPKIGENAYSEDFEVLEATTVQAIAVDSKSGKTSEVARVDFDLAKGNWKPITSDSNANWAIDEKSQTYWTSTENELELDLRDEVNLSGFTYLPMQARYPSGYISEYSLEVSLDGKTWKGISKGEFSNIQNSPIEQMVRFDQAAARFIRFKALKTTDRNPATFGEFGVLTR